MVTFALLRYRHQNYKKTLVVYKKLDKITALVTKKELVMLEHVKTGLLFS